MSLDIARAVWGTSEGLSFPRVVSQRSCFPQTPWHFSEELTEEERKGVGFTEGGRRGRKKVPTWRKNEAEEMSPSLGFYGVEDIPSTEA